MASSAMASAVVRRLVGTASSSSPRSVAAAAARRNVEGSRSLHSSGSKQMADHGHGHEHGSGGMYANNGYVHAAHMYDFVNMKNKKLKMGFMVFGSLGLGIAVPIFATHYHL